MRPREEARVHPSIHALTQVLQAATAMRVGVVDAPVDGMASDDVSIWAWRVDEVGALRQLQRGPEPASALPALQIHCLVFAPDLETLELLKAAAIRSSVAARGEQRVMIHHDALDTGVLLTLFLAARVQVRPCLSFELRVSPA